VRIAADDERHTAELRIFELLDGGEEGVQVEVGDNHPVERRPRQVVERDAIRRPVVITTGPIRLERGTAPQTRESHDPPRLSPS